MTELCLQTCFFFLFSEYKLNFDVALAKLHVLFENSSRVLDPRPSSVPKKTHELCLNLVLPVLTTTQAFKEVVFQKGFEVQ